MSVGRPGTFPQVKPGSSHAFRYAFSLTLDIVLLPALAVFY